MLTSQFNSMLEILQLKWKKLKNSIKYPSFYASSSLIEIGNFLVTTIIASVISILILNIIPKKCINADTVNFLMAILLSSVISFFLLAILFYRKHNDAFHYLIKIWRRKKIKKSEKEILEKIRAEYNNLLRDISKIPNEQIKSTYTNQIKIASIFSSLAKEKFYATSYDLPSHFYNKNKDYLICMDNSMRTVIGENKEFSIPNKARVFICSLDEFIEDIYSQPESLIFLIKWHLEWHKKTEVQESSSPIKFLLYRNEEEKNKMDDYLKDIGNDNIISDFMIVDDNLIYGRIEKNVITNNQVSLKAIINDKKSESIQKIINGYNNAFKTIYQVAIEPEQIYKLLNFEINDYKANMELIDKDLTVDSSKPFASQIYKFSPEDIARRKNLLKIEIQSKLKDYNDTQDRVNHYEKIFGENDNGINFTNTWVKLMKDGRYECIALDTADLRKGKSRFMDKWEEEPLYKRFLDASSESVKNNSANFKRIFILESKLEESLKNRFLIFLSEIVNHSNLNIGFILLETLIEKKVINDKDILLNSDFILLNIENRLSKPKNVYGFKITKNDVFDEKSLGFANNLIIPNEFKTLYNKFNEIYSYCVIFENSNDVIDNDKINKFIIPQ